jgi:hypothetical protein
VESESLTPNAVFARRNNEACLPKGSQSFWQGIFGNSFALLLAKHTNNMKNFTLTLLCIATLGLASCKKDTIINQTTPNRTIIFDRISSSWIPNPGAGFYVDLLANEFDLVNLKDEGVLVYIATDGTNATGYFQIPNSVSKYDYEIYQGKIRIYYDGTIRPSSTTRIKVVLIAAKNIS